MSLPRVRPGVSPLRGPQPRAESLLPPPSREPAAAGFRPGPPGAATGRGRRGGRRGRGAPGRRRAGAPKRSRPPAASGAPPARVATRGWLRHPSRTDVTVTARPGRGGAGRPPPRRRHAPEEQRLPALAGPARARHPGAPGAPGPGAPTRGSRSVAGRSRTRRSGVPEEKVPPRSPSKTERRIIPSLMLVSKEMERAHRGERLWSWMEFLLALYSSHQTRSRCVIA